MEPPQRPPDQGPSLARRVLVEGAVQGVGYRQSCADAARRLRVSGWVRNRRDGRVEAHFEGPPDVVARMVEWCRSGPALATVTSVVVSEVPPAALRGFRVSATE